MGNIFFITIDYPNLSHQGFSTGYDKFSIIALLLGFVHHFTNTKREHELVLSFKNKEIL